jgi:outer membrane protein with beta-barrel domain
MFSGARSNIPETGEFDGGTGIVGGVFAGRGWPGLLSIGGEALYAKKKVGTLDGQYTFDYLELPILVRFAVGLNNLYGATVYGLGGTSFDINLKSALDTGESFTDRTRRLDVGLMIGGGVELTRFLIEARYTHGLRSIVNPEDASLPGQQVKLHSFGVTFGVKLN